MGHEVFVPRLKSCIQIVPWKEFSTEIIKTKRTDNGKSTSHGPALTAATFYPALSHGSRLFSELGGSVVLSTRQMQISTFSLNSALNITNQMIRCWLIQPEIYHIINNQKQHFQMSISNDKTWVPQLRPNPVEAQRPLGQAPPHGPAGRRTRHRVCCAFISCPARVTESRPPAQRLRRCGRPTCPLCRSPWRLSTYSSPACVTAGK